MTCLYQFSFPVHYAASELLWRIYGVDDHHVRQEDFFFKGNLLVETFPNFPNTLCSYEVSDLVWLALWEQMRVGNLKWFIAMHVGIVTVWPLVFSLDSRFSDIQKIIFQGPSWDKPSSCGPSLAGGRLNKTQESCILFSLTGLSSEGQPSYVYRGRGGESVYVVISATINIEVNWIIRSN